MGGQGAATPYPKKNDVVLARSATSMVGRGSPLPAHFLLSKISLSLNKPIIRLTPIIRTSFASVVSSVIAADQILDDKGNQ